MISTMLPTATTLGLFISVFILIAPDGIFCLSTLYVEGDTSSRLSCKHDVPDHEFHRVKWFKSTDDDVYRNGPSALVSWDNTSDPIITNGNYSIDKDFSLVIHNTSNAKGIYRCSVTRNVPGDAVHYDVKVISYETVNPAHTLPVQYGQHLRIPCSSNSTSDGKVSVVWFKGESRDCFKSDDQPIASSIDGGSFPNYTLNDDFSLNIQNASTEYEAVYRSIVITTQETRPSARDTYVTVYVLPRKEPFIRHFFQGNTSFINCSVDRVYPLLYPKLNCLSNPQTYRVLNTDGTFNTSISGNVTHHGNDTIECTFPHFNYTEKSSLRIPVNISDEEEGPPPADCSASACLTHVASTIGIAFGVVLLGIGLITVAVVVRKMHRKQHQQKDEKISTPEMERMV